MPVVDRRAFGGRFTVTENAQRLANYRYLEVQLMEMLGGWSHTTPQLAFKATFGYHVYDHAQAADLLGERLYQLRSGREREEPATDDFAHLCEYVWNLTSPIDRLVGAMYFRIMLPLARPSLSTIAIFYFMWIWNDFIYPLVYMQSNDKFTVPLGVMFLNGQYDVEWGLQMAGLAVATIVPLIVYYVFQKQFIRGITAGALKG